MPPAARPGLYQELLGEEAVRVVISCLQVRFLQDLLKFSKYLLRADCMSGPMLSTKHIKMHGT